MPEVSFYILATPAWQARDLFVCKLVEKVYRQGVYSFILTASNTQSQTLDDLLWTFRASSFIPHQIYAKEDSAYPQQIFISADISDIPAGATVINLATHPIEQLLSAQRILEVVYQDPQVLQMSRSRYRQYQQAGITSVTHKL